MTGIFKTRWPCKVFYSIFILRCYSLHTEMLFQLTFTLETHTEVCLWLNMFYQSDLPPLSMNLCLYEMLCTCGTLVASSCRQYHILCHNLVLSFTVLSLKTTGLKSCKIKLFPNINFFLNIKKRPTTSKPSNQFSSL